MKMDKHVKRDIAMYADIIRLPHPVSKVHEQMPMQARAMQFSPFAALTGFEDRIDESARIVDERIILDDTQKDALDGRLRVIEAHLAEEPKVIFTYFLPDPLKDGGRYMILAGIVRRLDPIEGKIILKGGDTIRMEDVISIECEVLFSHQTPDGNASSDGIADD